MVTTSTTSQTVAAAVTAEAVRSCLVDLGWDIDLAGARALVAMQKTGGREFSTVIAWEELHDPVTINLTVSENSAEHDTEACKEHALALVEAIVRNCSNTEAPPP
jgi:hypothetical protein